MELLESTNYKKLYKMPLSVIILLIQKGSLKNEKMYVHVC